MTHFEIAIKHRTDAQYAMWQAERALTYATFAEASPQKKAKLRREAECAHAAHAALDALVNELLGGAVVSVGEGIVFALAHLAGWIVAHLAAAAAVVVLFEWKGRR